MSSPDTRGTKQTKRHPACPGKSRCKLPNCIHNACSNFSTKEIPFNLYEVNGMFGAYPSIRFAGGWLYQRLDTVSEGSDARGVSDKRMTTVGPMMYAAQLKIGEIPGIIFDKIKSCLNAEMPV